MSFKRIRHLGDLTRFGRNFRMFCACGRISIIDAWQLSIWQSAHDWPGDLEQIATRLRCSDCGRQGREWGSSAEAPNTDLRAVARARRASHLRRALFYRRLLGRP